MRNEVMIEKSNGKTQDQIQVQTQRSSTGFKFKVQGQKVHFK